MTTTSRSKKRGLFSGFLALLLIVVGTSALTWSAAYYHFSGMSAPLPETTFDVGSTAAPTPGSSSPALGSRNTRSPAPQPPAVAAPKLAKDTLDIPSLRITAAVDYFGIDANNELTLPEPSRVALFTYGSYPGDPRGTVLVAGHVNSSTLGAGALFRLGEIRQNANIWISDQTGKAYGYRAVKLIVLRKEALPQDIFQRRGDPRLVIVTCGGKIVATPTGHHYESNVIVYAAPLQEAA